jgi:hypothetical protein
MPSPLDRLIVDALDAYVEGDISLERFEDWFYPAALGVRRRGDPGAIELASAVKLALAEFKGGYRSEADLKAQLRAARPWIRRVGHAVMTSTDASTRSGTLVLVPA